MNQKVMVISLKSVIGFCKGLWVSEETVMPTG